MAYKDIADIAQDGTLQRRLLACAWEQRIANPAQWVSDHSWELAAQPGWAEAWHAADQGTPSIGSDESVITDAMILTAVQSLIVAV